jgi:iron complex outermembrane receptor protein
MLSHRVVTLVALVAVFVPPAPLRAQRPASTALDTIRVSSRATAPLAGATRSVEVLTRADLARLAGRSLAEVLGRALGADVQSRSPAQSDLALRGSTFNQVVVLVDGVRVSDVQSGHYAMDLAVPTAMIERIEILRGTGSALYGSDAVGGVVNIVTRDDAALRQLSLRGGSFGTAAAAALAASEVAGLRLAAGMDGDRSSGHRDGTDYDVTQLRASAARSTPFGRARLDVGQGLRRFGAADFYSPFSSEETTRSTTAALRLAGDDARPVALSVSLHTRRHRDLFTLKRDDPAFYQNDHLSWETGGDVTARGALSPHVTLAGGAELLDARLRSARLGDHAQLRQAAFAELTAAAARAVLNAGLRGDRVQGVADFLSPSLGVALPIAGTLQLRGSVSRGFRAPTWTERYYRDPANVADSALAVERFWSSEVGVRAAPAGLVFVDVGLFERRAADLVDWARPAGAPAGTPWRTMNFAEARYRGLEASFRAPRLGGVDWTLRASGLRFDASAAAGLEGKYALRPLTRTLGATASLPLADAGALTLDALRARRAGEADHTQLNARLGMPLLGLHATLELVNLTNASFLDASGKPVAGRSVFVGASLDVTR